MTETLAYGYSSESTQRELSHEYQHDRVKMVFEKLCILVLWIKVASALEGLRVSLLIYSTKQGQMIPLIRQNYEIFISNNANQIPMLLT